MATAKATTDHDEIRRWVEARGGHPARVRATGSRKDPGILRIDFPGFSGEETLEEIGWDEFFEWFDRNELAMLLSGSRRNRFNKLVSRATVGATSSKKRSAKKASKKAASAKKASTSKKSAKKSSAKKSSAKKSSAKKAASTKKASSAKKASAKKPSAKKAPARRTAAKKTSAKKSSAKKSSAKKSSAKKATPSRKSAGPAAAKTTTSRNTIVRWVEARGGYPAHVKSTEGRGGDPGVLRIDYPGFSGEGELERISWDEWFDAFNANKLAFLYQDKKNSRFSKLVAR